MPLLRSHWKWNTIGPGARQIWIDAAISCVNPVRWQGRDDTHHPPFPSYKYLHVKRLVFLHSSSRWDNKNTKEQSLLYKWKQIYKITSLIDKYNKYFMHHNSGQLHLKQVCWQVTKKLRLGNFIFHKTTLTGIITMLRMRLYAVSMFKSRPPTEFTMTYIWV